MLEIAASTVCLREFADRSYKCCPIDPIQRRPGRARFAQHNGGLRVSVARRRGKIQAGLGWIHLQVMWWQVNGESDRKSQWTSSRATGLGQRVAVVYIALPTRAPLRRINHPLKFLLFVIPHGQLYQKSFTFAHSSSNSTQYLSL